MAIATAARKRPFKLTEPKIYEHPLQRQMAGLLRLEIGLEGELSQFGVIWWAVDHANAASAGVGAMRKARGVIAGIPDIYLTHLGRAFQIEIKTRDGIMSEPQMFLFANLLDSGAPVAVIDRAEQLLAVLDQWRIPRYRRAYVAA